MRFLSWNKTWFAYACFMLAKKILKKACLAKVDPIVQLSLPGALYGKGKLLGEGRVAYDNADPIVSVKKQFFEYLQLPYESVPSPSIESTNEKQSVFQDLCNVFIQVTNPFSKNMCTELPASLQRNCGAFPIFTKKFTCYDDSLNHWKNHHDNDAIQPGFETQKISSTYGLMFKLYLNNPQLVIKEQMCHTALEDLRLQANSERVFSHPMNLEVGSIAVATIQQTIKYSQERYLTWKTKGNDGISSSSECFQLFNDKFRTPIKAGLVSFYCLHITLLNYSEEQCRRHITNGRTICAFLPVLFQRENDDFGDWKLSLLKKGTEHKNGLQELKFSKHCMKAYTLHWCGWRSVQSLNFIAVLRKRNVLVQILS